MTVVCSGRITVAILGSGGKGEKRSSNHFLSRDLTKSRNLTTEKMKQSQHLTLSTIILPQIACSIIKA